MWNPRSTADERPVAGLPPRLSRGRNAPGPCPLRGYSLPNAPAEVVMVMMAAVAVMVMTAKVMVMALVGMAMLAMMVVMKVFSIFHTSPKYS